MTCFACNWALLPVCQLPYDSVPKSTVTSFQTLTFISDKCVRAHGCPTVNMSSVWGLPYRLSEPVCTLSSLQCFRKLHTNGHRKASAQVTTNSQVLSYFSYSIWSLCPLLHSNTCTDHEEYVKVKIQCLGWTFALVLSTSNVTLRHH